MSLNIFIILGPPGGGKGSLSKLLTKNLAYLQLSTGNLCREHIANQTDIGKKIDFIIKSGKLISDSLISNMVEEWLISNKGSELSFIFDGYPRTVAQAKILNDLLKNKFADVKLNIVRLLIGEDIVVKRLSSRLICGNNKCQEIYSSDEQSYFASKKKNICDKCENILVQRLDDREEAIKERLEIYNKHEKELLDYYKDINQPVFEIDSQQNIENVFADFKKLI